MGRLLDLPKPALIAICIAAGLLAVTGISAAAGQLGGGVEEEAADITAGMDDDAYRRHAYLIQNTWRTAGNSEELRFSSDGTLTHVEADGDADTHSFELSDFNDLGSERGSEVPYAQFVITLDGDEQRVMTLREPTVDEAQDSATAASNAVIETTAYDGSAFFRVVDDTFRIYSFEPSLFSYAIADEQRFANDMRDWCADNAPLATSVTWGMESETDYSDNTVKTTFTCDDSTSTEVPVTFDAASKTYAIGE